MDVPHRRVGCYCCRDGVAVVILLFGAGRAVAGCRRGRQAGVTAKARNTTPRVMVIATNMRYVFHRGWRKKNGRRAMVNHGTEALVHGGGRETQGVKGIARQGQSNTAVIVGLCTASRKKGSPYMKFWQWCARGAVPCRWTGKGPRTTDRGVPRHRMRPVQVARVNGGQGGTSRGQDGNCCSHVYVVHGGWLRGPCRPFEGYMPGGARAQQMYVALVLAAVGVLGTSKRLSERDIIWTRYVAIPALL